MLGPHAVGSGGLARHALCHTHSLGPRLDSSPPPGHSVSMLDGFSLHQSSCTSQCVCDHATCEPIRPSKMLQSRTVNDKSAHAETYTVDSLWVTVCHQCAHTFCAWLLHALLRTHIRTVSYVFHGLSMHGTLGQTARHAQQHMCAVRRPKSWSGGLIEAHGKDGDGVCIRMLTEETAALRSATRVLSLRASLWLICSATVASVRRAFRALTASCMCKSDSRCSAPASKYWVPPHGSAHMAGSSAEGIDSLRKQAMPAALCHNICLWPTITAWCMYIKQEAPCTCEHSDCLLHLERC